MILPILMDSRREPERCPHCKEIISAPSTSFIDVLWIIGFVLVFFWLVVTLMEWMFGFREQTLVQILHAQGAWFVNLLGRIW